MILSSASQNFKRKSGMSPKATSEAPPEEEASRLRPTWGYEVGVVQGKHVTFILNAPTNVLAILMRKDT